MVLQNMEKGSEMGIGNGEYDKRPKRFDVTTTMAYKELYANNLRMYSFLMKKELDRRSQQKLQNRKEDYFQKHVTSQNNQRNNRLLKSFKQMSRMRSCLSDLDLSRSSDTESDHHNNNPHNFPLERQYRKQSLLDVRRPDQDGVTILARPRAMTSIGHINFPIHSNDSFEKDQGKSKRTRYLRVPAAAEKPVSPLASPTSTVNCTVVLSTSPTTPLRERYSMLNRRHFSDLGMHRSPELDASSDSDVAYSDSEVQIEIDSRSRSPSMNRARQAKIRHEYRKARIASLEGTITQANSILKDIKKNSIPRKISEEDKKNEFGLEDENAKKYLSLPLDLSKF